MMYIYFKIIQVLNIILIQLDYLRLIFRSQFIRQNIIRMGGVVQTRFQMKSGARLFFTPQSQLKIGKNCRLDENCCIYIFSGANLDIGDNVFLGKGSVLATSQQIIIGSDTQIAHYVTIIDTDHRYGDSSVKIHESDKIADGIRIGKTDAIHIGKNVWIGANAIILKGISIGDNSVIGAGAVVTKSIAARCIATGNPAVSRSMEI